jgi:hypothetical protein
MDTMSNKLEEEFNKIWYYLKNSYR